MAAVCGWAGDRGEPAELARMLDSARRPGEECQRWLAPGVALGRSARNVAESTADPILTIGRALGPDGADPEGLRALLRGVPGAAGVSLDGSFAGAAWDATRRRLTLACDPLGARTLFIHQRDDTLYFASEIKQLVGLPWMSTNLDLAAIHHYLTFSFVPGDATPLRAIRRLAPGHLARFESGKLQVEPYTEALGERSVDIDPAAAATQVATLLRSAVARRLEGGPRAVYLSGGLDSSLVAWQLRELGASPRAITADFGRHSVERREARTVARHLGLAGTRVRVTGRRLRAALLDAVYDLDLPYGDAAAFPQYFLARAAREAGIAQVWNGEGGDQIFGGWNNRAMIAAEVYGGSRDRAAALLRSQHRFHGLEEQLYAPALLAEARHTDPAQHVIPHLERWRGTPLLNRLRRIDLALRGARNLAPRAQAIAGAAGLELAMPLFDADLTAGVLALPGSAKLRGANEKALQKQLARAALPAEIVERRKSGMCAPANHWVRWPLARSVRELLGPGSLAARGLFRPEYIAALRAGEDVASEVRGRRIGEKLWLLTMLEAWLRVFVDGRGRAPSEGSAS